MLLDIKPQNHKPAQPVLAIAKEHGHKQIFGTVHEILAFSASYKRPCSKAKGLSLGSESSSTYWTFEPEIACTTEKELSMHLLEHVSLLNMGIVFRI